MTPDATVQTQQRPLTRADLARQLLARVEQLPALLGTVPLATELQLLKRDLSRGHDVLRAAPGESNFLSVVTLVESALACLTWKQYTPEVVEALRQAFATGISPRPFTFADYDAVRRHFVERGVPTLPAIDLDSLTPEDLDDGQEG
jgi:hypothetical protein